MPHDVIMPALGMAQDSGLIVAWHKLPGDEIAVGDVLFEVETDKATMEVEAAAAGYLTDVGAGEGDDVPVGKIIARISKQLGEKAATKAKEPETQEDLVTETALDAVADEAELPKGHSVIMPTLGMAQDSGLLVAWSVAPGDKVSEGDVLFEVETDKSTMEVEALASGYVGALLAEEGEEIPTGQTIAILTDDLPVSPIRRAAGASKAQVTPATEPEPGSENEAGAPKPAPNPTTPVSSKRAATTPAGRVLASPKARRLAYEAGIDLARVAANAGQPLHAADVEAYVARGDDSSERIILTADVPAAPFADFAAWAAAEAGLADPLALLAGLAATGLGGEDAHIAVDNFGDTAMYHVAGPSLSQVTPAEAVTLPDLTLYDLRGSCIASAATGAGPGISIGDSGDRLVLTLDYSGSALSPADCIRILSEFAGRLEEPLRHLL